MLLTASPQPRLERASEEEVERLVPVLVEAGSQVQRAERRVHAEEEATVGPQIVQAHIAAVEPSIARLEGKAGIGGEV